MVVEAKLNGKGPIRISPALAKSLGLEKVEETVAGDSSGRNMKVRPVMRIDRVEIGEGRFSGVESGEIRVAGYAQSHPRVDIVDLFPVANLGSRFLRQYTVTFDLANKRMALEN